MNNESNVSSRPSDADHAGAVSVALNSDRNERYARLELEGMAECMDMVRQELIDGGIIGASTPPMMVGSAVIKFVNELRSSHSAGTAQLGAAQA